MKTLQPQLRMKNEELRIPRGWFRKLFPLNFSLLILLALGARATTIIFNTSQLTGSVLNRPITIVPDSRINASNHIIYAGPAIILSPTNGVAVTNLLAGRYCCTIQGVSAPFCINVTNSIASLYAADLTDTSTTSTPTGALAWTQAASDARYQPIATNAPGVAGQVYATDGTNGYFAAAGGGGTNIPESSVQNLPGDLAAKLSTNLASARVFVGTGSSGAAAVLFSGDATNDNAGVVTLANSSATRGHLGLGTSATRDAGTLANQVMLLDSGGAITVGGGANLDGTLLFNAISGASDFKRSALFEGAATFNSLLSGGSAGFSGTVTAGAFSGSGASLSGVPESGVTGLLSDLSGRVLTSGGSLSNAQFYGTTLFGTNLSAGLSAFGPTGGLGLGLTNAQGAGSLRATNNITADGQFNGLDAGLTNAGGAAISHAGHVHSGADITSGTVAAARLGSGSPSASTYLLGNGTWGTDASFVTGLTAAQLPATTPYILDRTVTTNDITSTASDTSLYSVSIPASGTLGNLGSTKTLRTELCGDFLQNASLTTTITIKLGSTIMYQQSGVFGAANNGSRHAFRWTFWVSAQNSTSVQKLCGDVAIGPASSAGTGLGNLSGSMATAPPIIGAAAVDGTVAQTFDVRIQPSGSSSSYSLRLFSAEAVVY